MNRPGTAPGSHGLKGQRLTFRLAVLGSGQRFQRRVFAGNDAPGFLKVMHPLALHLHGLKAGRAVHASNLLTLFVLLVGSPVRNRTCVNRLSTERSATELRDRKLVRLDGIEPPASAMSRRRSTAELKARELVLPDGLEPPIVCV